MEAKEKAQQILEEVLPAVRELAADGWALVEEAEREAYANLASLGRAIEEREDVAKRIEAIRRELESGPGRLARATLEENWQAEHAIRERYKRLKAELEALEEERKVIEAEQRGLMGPNASRKGHKPHRNEAVLYQRRRISKALADAMGPLHVLDKLAAAIRGELQDFQGRAGQHRGGSESLNYATLSDKQAHGPNNPGRIHRHDPTGGKLGVQGR